jgi:hypothetical protein
MGKKGQKMVKRKNRYSQIIETIFSKHFIQGTSEVQLERSDITHAAKELHIKLPKNLGDVLYSFRYRAALPDSIVKKAPEGYEWIIRPAGRSRYKFVLVTRSSIIPSKMLAETKIPDATPGVIIKYKLNDEQALLAKLRYNRLIDIFTGLTCYSLQNHLRTTVPELGQVETDEIYIGIDKRGAHYVLPVQAKGTTDKVGIVQIEQDFAVCKKKFPGLICKSIATQSIEEDLIALFECEQSQEGIRVSSEKHYRLVDPDELSLKEIESYSRRLL